MIHTSYSMVQMDCFRVVRINKNVLNTLKIQSGIHCKVSSFTGYVGITKEDIKITNSLKNLVSGVSCWDKETTLQCTCFKFICMDVIFHIQQCFLLLCAYKYLYCFLVSNIKSYVTCKYIKIILSSYRDRPKLTHAPIGLHGIKVKFWQSSFKRQNKSTVL